MNKKSGRPFAKYCFLIGLFPLILVAGEVNAETNVQVPCDILSDSEIDAFSKSVMCLEKKIEANHLKAKLNTAEIQRLRGRIENATVIATYAMCRTVSVPQGTNKLGYYFDTFSVIENLRAIPSGGLRSIKLQIKPNDIVHWGHSTNVDCRLDGESLNGNLDSSSYHDLSQVISEFCQNLGARDGRKSKFLLNSTERINYPLMEYETRLLNRLTISYYGVKKAPTVGIGIRYTCVLI